LITQCKGVIYHPFKTAKIIVFDPMKYKSPNVHLQDELLHVTWTSQLRTGQRSIMQFKFGTQPTVSHVLQNWSKPRLTLTLCY